MLRAHAQQTQVLTLGDAHTRETHGHGHMLVAQSHVRGRHTCSHMSVHSQAGVAEAHTDRPTRVRRRMGVHRPEEHTCMCTRTWVHRPAYRHT